MQIKKGYYLVGGAVRDKILGLKPKDKDYLAVGYSEEEMLRNGFLCVGKHFPVFLHPHTKEEYALPRRERSTGKKYTDFVCETENVSVEEDLKRRDLTINSILEISEGLFFDPFNGKEDIENKILRHTSGAFIEDPLRVLRVARFRARYPDFNIAEETCELIKSMRDMLSSLSKERIFSELKKALSEESPHMFFITLRELGVLDIIFPDLFSWTNVYHENKYHMEGSIFNHAMLVLSEASKISKSKRVRFGALFHDIGKATSYNISGNFHMHYNRDLVNDLVIKLKDNYCLPNKYVKVVKTAALFHHKIYKVEEMKASSIVRMFTDKDFPQTEEELEKLLDISIADSFGRIIHISGPRKVLNIYKSLYALKKEIYSEGEYNKSVYKPGNTERKDFVNAKLIKEIFHKIKKVNVRDFTKKEYSGEKIKQELHKRRIAAVLNLKNSYKE